MSIPSGLCFHLQNERLLTSILENPCVCIPNPIPLTPTPHTSVPLEYPPKLTPRPRWQQNNATPYNTYPSGPSDTFNQGGRTPAYGGGGGGGGGGRSTYIPPTPTAMDMDAPTPGGSSSRAGYYGSGAQTPAWGGGAGSGSAGDGPRYSTPSP